MAERKANPSEPKKEAAAAQKAERKGTADPRGSRSVEQENQDDNERDDPPPAFDEGSEFGPLAAQGIEGVISDKEDSVEGVRRDGLVREDGRKDVERDR